MLDVKKLSKVFNVNLKGSKIIEGCENINFTVKKGEFVSIVGPSGSGKSTILKCIYRTYIPSGGSILYDSSLFGKVDIAKLSDRQMLALRKREIGYVSQFLRVIPRVSALDIVAEPLIFRNGISPHRAKELSAELLLKLNIPSYLFESYPSTFSGGEQQRINIARAIIWKPKLLLLDEPTSSLDKDSIRTVISLFLKLRDEGSAIIAVFHDEELANSISDKVYKIKRAFYEH